MALVLAARCKTRARHLDLHHAVEQPPATKRNTANQQRCLFTARLAAHGHQQCQPEHWQQHCQQQWWHWCGARADKIRFFFWSFGRFSNTAMRIALFTGGKSINICANLNIELRLTLIIYIHVLARRASTRMCASEFVPRRASRFDLDRSKTQPHRYPIRLALQRRWAS